MRTARILLIYSDVFNRPELSAVKVGVKSTGTHKLVVSYAPYYLTVFHDHNKICVFDGIKAVRHDKRGAPAHKLGKRFLNLDLGARVDRGGSLIKYKHWRESKHNARNAQKLLLPLGKLRAVLAEHSVISLR